MGINYNWSFFSPSPPSALYFRYDVAYETESGDELKPMESFVFPDESKISSFDNGKRRFSTAQRFFNLQRDALRELFIPWVCKNHSGASHVYVSTETVDLLTIETAQLNSESPLSELYQKHKTEAQRFSCADSAEVSTL